MGRGGGQVVSVLAFYSDNPSSNTAGVVLAKIIGAKRQKSMNERPGLAYLRILFQIAQLHRITQFHH